MSAGSWWPRAVGPVPDLAPLGLPPAETALLRLLLEHGQLGVGDAATRLGLSVQQVSRAGGALRDRGFVVAGLGRRYGLLLAPLDRALAALVEARREAGEAAQAAVEETCRDLLAVARWAPDGPDPHRVVSRDLRDDERREEMRRVRRSLDVVLDRHHRNGHVTGALLRVPRHPGCPRVRLLVTGAEDDRPVVLAGRSTDADAPLVGIATRRHPDRCAAFAVYDDRRVEVPLSLQAASGWTDEPGEVRAAARLFALLWAEATPWPPDDAVERGSAVRAGPDVGSAP